MLSMTYIFVYMMYLYSMWYCILELNDILAYRFPYSEHRMLLRMITSLTVSLPLFGISCHRTKQENGTHFMTTWAYSILEVSQTEGLVWNVFWQQLFFFCVNLRFKDCSISHIIAIRYNIVKPQDFFLGFLVYSPCWSCFENSLHWVVLYTAFFSGGRAARLGQSFFPVYKCKH